MAGLLDPTPTAAGLLGQPSPEAGGLLGLPPSNRVYDALSGGASWLADRMWPFVPPELRGKMRALGEIAHMVSPATAVQTYTEDMRDGRYGSAALNAAGLIPGEALAAGAAKFAMAIPAAAKGIRAYHGTTKVERDSIRSGGFNVPKGTREDAVFLTDTPSDAYEFARMRTSDPTQQKVIAATVDPADFYRVNARGEVYDPDMMARILAEARAAGAPGAAIRNVQNFEHSGPSTTYAVFDPSLIDIIRKYGLAGIPAAGVVGGALSERN